MVPRPLWRKGVAVCLSLVLGLAVVPALLAQNGGTEPSQPAPVSEQAPTPQAEAPEDAPSVLTELDPTLSATGQAALEQIQRTLNLTEERAEALRREIEAYEGDRDRQNAELIAAAQRVRLAEIEVGAMEERLDQLIVAEIEVRGRLQGADDDIANVLAALEQVSRNPPPALIVDPSDALGSARSAILMAAILPQLRAKADAVTADLQALSDIKAKALEEEALLRANFAILEEEQLRIATLILARNRGVEEMTADLAAQEQEVAELAARATSLKELTEQLASRAQAVAQPPNIPPEAPRDVQVALANTGRTEPALPFEQAKGLLTMPSAGVNVIDFGASDGFGGISEGISIVTRADAPVVAPSDGWVLYRGPFLNYGQIVILNGGEDYTVLLAGLATVSVEIGQFVRMGEPIGTMGSRTVGQAVTTTAGDPRPTLYVEIRKANEPVDPTGWWAPQPDTQSG